MDLTQRHLITTYARLQVKERDANAFTPHAN
jgi:hypothetical protein